MLGDLAEHVVRIAGEQVAQDTLPGLLPAVKRLGRIVKCARKRLAGNLQGEEILLREGPSVGEDHHAAKMQGAAGEAAAVFFHFCTVLRGMDAAVQHVRRHGDCVVAAGDLRVIGGDTAFGDQRVPVAVPGEAIGRVADVVERRIHDGDRPAKEFCGAADGLVQRRAERNAAEIGVDAERQFVHGSLLAASVVISITRISKNANDKAHIQRNF